MALSALIEASSANRPKRHPQKAQVLESREADNALAMRSTREAATIGNGGILLWLQMLAPARKFGHCICCR
jgi:hypothetical protein